MCTDHVISLTSSTEAGKISQTGKQNTKLLSVDNATKKAQLTWKQQKKKTATVSNLLILPTLVSFYTLPAAAAVLPERSVVCLSKAFFSSRIIHPTF